MHLMCTVKQGIKARECLSVRRKVHCRLSEQQWKISSGRHFPAPMIAGDVVILNLLEKLGYLSSGKVPVIFIDTFHLFQETHDFMHRLEVNLPSHPPSLWWKEHVSYHDSTNKSQSQMLPAAVFCSKCALVRTISARRLSYLISPLSTVEQPGRRAGFSDAGL